MQLSCCSFRVAMMCESDTSVAVCVLVCYSLLEQSCPTVWLGRSDAQHSNGVLLLGGVESASRAPEPYVWHPCF